MKRIELILLFIIGLGIYNIYSQNTIFFEYEYDAAGNRIRRAVIEISNQQKSAKIDTLIEKISNYEVSVYPNPVTESLYVNITSTQNSDFQQKYEIFDVNGKLIYKDVIKTCPQAINFQKYTPGIYFLRLYFEEKYNEYKIVKKH